ncbi:MAG: AlpA family phage regulatory protein [Balneolaceae bacterium]
MTVSKGLSKIETKSGVIMKNPHPNKRHNNSSLQIIRPKELAELLSISIPTLYRMKDELPSKVKLSENGRAVGWRMSDIEAYLIERTETKI